MLAGLLLAGWSVALFTIVPAEARPELRAFEERLLGYPLSVSVPFTAALMALAVLFEEFAWRGVGQVATESLLVRSGLSRRGAALAAAIVMSAGWAFNHTGSIDPFWLKFMQIFPMGLVLAGLLARFGMVAAVTAHGLHNLALVIVVLAGGTQPGVS
jgi:hypothetical protein